MIATESAPAHQGITGGRELVVADLLDDFGELEQLLTEELERESWLDAFLLAAGMNQLVEDYLHRDPASLGKLAASLSSITRIGGILARSALTVRRAAAGAREATASEKAIAAWQRDLAALVLALARRVASTGTVSGAEWRGLEARAKRLPSRLRSEVLRLPSCFRSLDLTPEDVQQLAASFASQYPDRARDVSVVGIRTSGSYLAPLMAAYLIEQGFAGVSVHTVRPGHGFLHRERRELELAATAMSIVALVDDPPSTGRAVARVASLLEDVGFAGERIVACLPMLAEAAIPEPLRGRRLVVLKRQDWAIERRLRPAAVRATLAGMLGTAIVDSVRRVPLPDIDDPWEDAVDRRHARALYEIDAPVGSAGPTTRLVYAKGVGLGYFGRHSLAVAEAIRGFVPDLYGLQDGVLFREWQAEAWRAGRDRPVGRLPERMAAYVDARRRALPARRDLALRMVGRQAVWQRLADVLLEPCGRLRLPLRPIVHRLTRRLVRTEHPSIVDGSMGLQHWFVPPTGPAVKADNDERAYSNEDIYSYDAVYDLGSAAASLRAQVGPDPARRIRDAYEAISREQLDEERWFLYQLLSARLHKGTLHQHLRNAAPHKRPRLIRLLDGVEAALEEAQREYLRACFLDDVPRNENGLLCAIDIDGTLESAPLGFTAIGPTGAMALRALGTHGFRAVLASGRSLDDVRLRCERYSLAAGVAEYGAVVYDAIHRETAELLNVHDRANLDRIRSALAVVAGVHLAPEYLRSVRAFTVDRRGHKRGLAADVIAGVLGTTDVAGAVVPIQGWSQTDFVSASVTKADGLRVAASRLGSDSRSTLVELAVGDAATDLPMLQVARLACAPANGDPHLRREGVRFMRGSGQQGVAEAVSLLLGHAPGACRLCRPPIPGDNRRLLLQLLALYERRGIGRVAAAARLAWDVSRTR